MGEPLQTPDNRRAAAQDALARFTGQNRAGGWSLAALSGEAARQSSAHEMTESLRKIRSESVGRACDHLDEDLASGYVSVLHEMFAACWPCAAIYAAGLNSSLEWPREPVKGSAFSGGFLSPKLPAWPVRQRDDDPPGYRE